MECRSSEIHWIMLQQVTKIDPVLQSWTVKATSKEIVPALDYITMNRNTVKQRIITPKAIRKFRDEHPVRLKELDHGFKKNINGLKARKPPLPSDADPNFTYGMPTRF